MRRTYAAAIALAAFALSIPPIGPARAQAATAEGATTLQQQLQAWLAATFGADRPLLSTTPTIEANGDHYDIAFPIFDASSSLRMTASARDQGGGRWAMSDVKQSSPAEFTLALPQPATADGKPARVADVSYDMTIGAQAGQAMLDTTLQTPSTLSLSGDDLLAHSHGASPSTTHVDHYGSTLTVAAGKTPGRMDATAKMTLKNYRANATSPQLGAFAFVFGDTTLEGSATDLSVGRMHDAMQAEFAFLISAMPQPNHSQAAPDPASVAAMLEALIDSAGSTSAEQRSTDVSVTMREKTFTLHGLDVGFGAKATDGLSSMRFDLGLDGLGLPDLGLGGMATLIPSKIVLRPTLAGVPVAALLGFLQRMRADQAPQPQDVMALFAKGPITAGLETLTVDVGGAEFTGRGTLDIVSPGDLAGTARVTATNLDLLQETIAVQPGLAQAGAAIIFLKGIGRMADNQMVWDITFKDRRLLVNNQDLSAMMGGGARHERAAPPQTPPPSPGPQGDRPQLRRRP